MDDDGGADDTNVGRTEDGRRRRDGRWEGRTDRGIQDDDGDDWTRRDGRTEDRR